MKNVVGLHEAPMARKYATKTRKINGLRLIQAQLIKGELHSEFKACNVKAYIDSHLIEAVDGGVFVLI